MVGGLIIKPMQFEFIKHSECSDKLLNDICELKKQHWNYPMEAQKQWLKENILYNDIHLLLKDSQGLLIAYLSLVEIRVNYQGIIVDMLGVGSVCVDKNHIGKHLGLLLMNLVDFYLKKHKKQGVLLCNDKLVDFYSKCGWSLFKGKVYCKDVLFEQYTFFTEEKKWNKIEISKLF